ncbi:coiled-coil domain-containing protein [Clostridium felsineum]|uniref:Nuclease SbcCD subunit C n=1 Tax=Clostridium felsineum TaxID=36839 RepID=A0A1S8KYI5_9CLOT|nr:hypothetical protein [Clostridium felsineum]URZ05954.1 hypothetical protein CLROS_012860 [Clostridium felsineum]URZ10991.1 hypothetical protein CROST_017070 [Clostridium felsineum]
MKIKEITMSGFKNNDTVQELTGFDLFTGSNGKGKSSRLQAIALAMMGYIPQYGKNLAEIYKLASDKEINVGLKLDNNFSFDRSILRKITTKRKTGDKEIKYGEELTLAPNLGEKKIADKEARIKSELGNFPMMLDFQDFLNMSDNEKRKFIYSLTGVNATLWNKASIKKYLENKLLTLELQVKKPEQYEGMKTIINEVMKDYVDGIDVQVAIENLIDRSKEKLSYYKENALKTAGTVQKLAELKNSTNVEGDFKEVQDELKSLQDKLMQTEKLISTSTERKKVIDNRLNKINILKIEIANLQRFKPSNDLEGLNNRIKYLNSKLQNEIVNYDDKIKEVVDKIQKLQSELPKKQNEAQEIIRKGTEKKTVIETYEKSLKDIASHDGKCLVDARIKCNKDFSKFKSYAEELAKNTKIEKDNLLNKYKSVKAEIIEIQNEIKDLENKRHSILSEERELNNKNTSINNEILKVTSQINSTKTDIKLNSEKLKLKQEELSNLQNEMAITEPAVPIDALQKQAAALRNTIKTLEGESKLQEKSKNDYENLKKVMLENKTSELNVVLLNQLIDALGAKGLQGEIMKQGIEPLKSLVQENLKLLGIKNEFSFICESEKGKEIFQFGWINEKKSFVDFNALSTGQQMVLLIAFLTAVIEKKSPKLKVLMIDNLNDLDSINLKNVLSGLKSLSSKLDNILIAGVINEKIDDDVIKVWNLDEIVEENKDMEVKEEII